MNRWIYVFRYELRMQFRRKTYLLLTFGVPVLALALFFGYQVIRNATRGDESTAANPILEEAEESETTTIGYVDLTPQGLFPSPESYPGKPDDCRVEPGELQTMSAALIKRLSSPYCLRGSVIAYDSQRAGLDALDAGAISALYVIPEDYVETGKISLYIASISAGLMDNSPSALMENFVIASLLAGVEPQAYEELYLRLRTPANLTTHSLGEGQVAESDEGQNFAITYAFGIILMLSLFWGGGYLMQSVVQEKESRVIEIILSSVRPVPLLLGKILAMGLMSILQVVMLLGTALFIMSRAGEAFGVLEGFELEPGALVIALLYFVLGFLMFGSLMAAIGALTNTVRESQNYVSLVTLPAMVPFFFLTIFAEEPNGTFATVLSIFPITAPLSMIMRASVTSVPAGQLALSLALLALTVAFVIWLSGRLFRVNTLLMGKTPRLKDVPRLIRG